MQKKTLILILVCIVLSIALATGAAFLLVHITKKGLSEESASSGPESTVSDVSSALPVVAEPVPEPEIGLSFSSPQDNTVTTTDAFFRFAGGSDPAQPVLMNGTEIERNADGSFSLDVNLSVGKNEFTFTHKGQTVTKTIQYRYVIIQSYSPRGNQSFESGATFRVTVRARAGSAVYSEFHGETIRLTRTELQEDDTLTQSDDFADFIGQFTLPGDNAANLSLGKVWVSANYNGSTERFSSGNITCKKAQIHIVPDDTIPPNNKNYNAVGAGYIAEIVGYTAETFTTSDPNLWCLPTNNYLPQGTVDYCSPSFFRETGSGLDYAVLRCGRNVLLEKKDVGSSKSTVTRCYEGMLPDHNEVHLQSLSVNGHHSVLTLNTLWKAPFFFELKDQGFADPAHQNYTFSNTTFSYVDITFCYATVLDGEIEIPGDHPLFSRAEIIPGNREQILRLYLKKTGAFYGWDANYNAQGQLCFSFLNPTPAQSASNAYGADLSGITILLDVGHGGADGGAPALNPGAGNEAVQNLRLANQIRSELESMGATVVMNRTDNTTNITQQDRCRQVKTLAPDLVLCIHHNSANSSAANGFDAYYFAPFSKKAAESVYQQTRNTGLYQKYGLNWHAYYVGRMSSCPVVLTENGYISNSYDFQNIVNDASSRQKAQAIARGIVNYFLSLN